MSIDNNPYPKGSLLSLAWTEGYIKGWKDSHLAHMKIMRRSLPTVAQDIKKFYETEFKEIIELEEAKLENEIMMKGK